MGWSNAGWRSDQGGWYKNASGGGAFTPAALSNLYSWYKADAGVFSDAGVTPATNGSAAAQWNDQSGVSGINLSITGTGITYATGALNGKPVVSSAGGATALIGSSYALGGSQVSVWMVFKATGTSVGRAAAYVVSGSDTSATSFIAAYLPSLTAVNAYNNGIGGVNTLVSGSWNTIASIWESTGSTSTMYVGNSGGTPVSQTPTFAASGDFYVFNTTGLVNDITGSMAELVVVKGAMSPTDRSNLATYSLGKYGV